MKFSSLAALEVVKMTTSTADSDENLIKIVMILFQWVLCMSLYLLHLILQL